MLNALVDILLDIALIVVILAIVISVTYLIVLLIQIMLERNSEEGDSQMKRKIINLTKETDGSTCLLCCEREATVKVAINRVKYDDNVIGFHVCDKCLSVMQQDIQKICE